MSSARFFYPPPPLAQRNVPPRLFVPITPADPTADEVPQGQNRLQAILRWYLSASPIRQAPRPIASLLFEVIAPDDPPLRDNAALLRILTFRSLIPLSQQKLTLSPLLLGSPEDTLPPLPFRLPLDVIYNYTRYSKSLPQQRYAAIRDESDIVYPVSRTGVAFQASAFQSQYPGVFYAFQAVENIIAFSDAGNGIRVRDFLTIFVGPLMKEYARTAAIVIECQVLDPNYTPALPIDATSVEINLLRPDNTSEVTLGAMSNISTGFYRYTFQSDSNDTLGVYTMNIKATNGSNVAQTITQAAFRLIAN